MDTITSEQNKTIFIIDGNKFRFYKASIYLKTILNDYYFNVLAKLIHTEIRTSNLPPLTLLNLWKLHKLF